MSDYFAFSLASVAATSELAASAPVYTSDTSPPRPVAKDTTSTQTRPVLGLAIHLVQTPHGSMNEQQAAQRIQDMEHMAQELEIALAKESVPEIILVEADESSTGGPIASQPHPETSLPVTNCSAYELIAEAVVSPVVAPIIEATFASLFCGPRTKPSSSTRTTVWVPAAPIAGLYSSASFSNLSPTTPSAEPSEIICVPPNTVFRVDRSSPETNAAPTFSAIPWFSKSYDPCSTSPVTASMTKYPQPSAYIPPSLTYPHTLKALSADIEIEEFDIVILSPTIPHQAEQLKEPSAVLPSITFTSSEPTPSYTSFGDGRLQPSLACANLAELIGSDDDEDEDAVIFCDDEDHAQALPVQAAASTSAARHALPLIATASTCDTLLALPSPSVELSPTGTTPKPIVAYTQATTLSDQRPREKKRHAVDHRQPSSSTSYAIKEAYTELNTAFLTSSSAPAPVASDNGAPPTRISATLPKRPSSLASRAPRTPIRPNPTIYAPFTTTGTAGQSQKLKRKRDDKDDEEHGEKSSSGGPAGRPSNSEIARDAPPASKKPKSRSSQSAAPPAPAPTPSRFRSAADLAHKRWEERMQQQSGGRMRVVSTDHLAMRAKVRRSRASNVGR